MPLFSIIIPVYNVQNYLSACVKSVVEQPGPRDWECRGAQHRPQGRHRRLAAVSRQ